MKDHQLHAAYMRFDWNIFWEVGIILQWYWHLRLYTASDREWLVNNELVEAVMA
jgi:hypothetical protein